MASTSSVYGINEDMSLHLTLKCYLPMSFYAATKNLMKPWLTRIPIYMTYHNYVWVFNIYGRWGRLDMAFLSLLKTYYQESVLNL